MQSKNSNKLLVMPVTARWRIVGWIVLTTALIVLAIILSARAIFQGQVRHDANAAIVQEVNEFRTFVTESTDPRTGRPFNSLTALMERYLQRQTPDWGEAFIAVTPTDVMFVDNASGDAGERLAGDRTRLNELLNQPLTSGVLDTPDGELRWGKSTIEARGEQATLLVLEFVQGRMANVRKDMMILFGIMLVGMLLTAVIAWVVAGQILAPVTRFSELSARVGPLDLNTRLPEHGRDELSDLARAINSMLDRLGMAQADQRHVLAETLQQIRTVNDQLSRLGSAQSSPAVMENALKNMRQLQEDLQLLLTSGNSDFLHVKDIELSAFTYQLTQHIRDTFPNRAWQVAEVGEARVGLDRRHVVEAMQHLAARAVDQTNNADPIELGSSIRTLPNDEKMVSLWISNQGAPLTAQQAKDIFDAKGGDLDINADPLLLVESGSNLGLSVVKALAHAHGGYAWVESSPERGTVFGIDLPLKLANARLPIGSTEEALLGALSQEKP